MVQSFTTLTRTQTDQALNLYAKVGDLDCYTRLPLHVKRKAASDSIASVMRWSVVDLAQIVATCPAFCQAADSIVSIFEAEHPNKVDDNTALANAIHEIEMAGMIGVPTNETETLALIKELATAGLVPQEIADELQRQHDERNGTAKAHMVGFDASHMAHDGTPDAKTDAEFEAIINAMESEDKSEPERRFVVDSDGSTEDESN